MGEGSANEKNEKKTTFYGRGFSGKTHVGGGFPKNPERQKPMYFRIFLCKYDSSCSINDLRSGQTCVGFPLSRQYIFEIVLLKFLLIMQ